MREEARLRQRAQPLPKGDAPPQKPEPAKSPYPERPVHQPRVGLHLLPESLQGTEGSGERVALTSTLRPFGPALVSIALALRASLSASRFEVGRLAREPTFCPYRFLGADG